MEVCSTTPARSACCRTCASTWLDRSVHDTPSAFSMARYFDRLDETKHCLCGQISQTSCSRLEDGGRSTERRISNAANYSTNTGSTASSSCFCLLRLNHSRTDDAISFDQLPATSTCELEIDASAGDLTFDNTSASTAGKFSWFKVQNARLAASSQQSWTALHLA